MAHSPDIDQRYSITVPLEAQALITGYNETNPWLNQANDVMRGLFMGGSTARAQAISHRNFTVGAFATGLRQALPDGSHIYRSFHGANEKPIADGSVNIHAEAEIVHEARRYGSVLTTMVLYGDNQPDQKSGIAFPAIVPCSAVCLPMLKSAECINDRLTVLSSLSPDRKTVMLYTLPELEAAYSRRDPDMLYSTSFEVELGQFDPLSDQQDIDDTTDDTFEHEYTEKVSQVLLAHFMAETS
jgi:hypothetical protein